MSAGSAAPPGGRVTLGAAYFDGMYAASDDPWGFTSRWYESRKYALSLAMLPSPHYRRGFEPGCSVGVLSAMLAPRCDDLLSCDVAPAAVAAAAQRTRDLPQVRVAQRAVPGDWPDGRFDLVVFSEMLYYLGDEDLARTLDLAAGSLEDGGTLLAVHWRHQVSDYPRTGDDVHAALAARKDLMLAADHQETDFVAQVYRRFPAGTDPAAVSVAAAEGIA